MADVVGWSDAAGLAPAFACNATCMTTIEDGEKPGAEGKVAIKSVEVVIGDRGFFSPGEIVRDKTFVDVIDRFRSAVAGQLRAVAAVEQDPLHTVADIFEQPA